MSAAAAAALPAARSAPIVNPGRPFVSLPFDYLLVGSGWSVFLVVFLVWGGGTGNTSSVVAWLPAALLLGNSAHVAASTVRLYTKPGGFRDFRFLTMGFPLVTVAVLSLALVYPGSLGHHLQALYATWNPYHYAAQAYGLAVMYCYRSGCVVSDADKRLMWLTCLSPFAYAFVDARGSGVEWLLPASFLGQPAVQAARRLLVYALMATTFVLPVVLYGGLLLRRRVGLPLISLLTIFTNGIWWVALPYVDALLWGTVFHGVQYIAIATIFHVKDQMQRPSNRHGWLHHSARFYVMCVALAYLLFQVWPFAYILLGFGWAESMLLVTAVLSLHHVIVDAYIWRLRRDPNYKIVTAAA